MPDEIPQPQHVVGRRPLRSSCRPTTSTDVSPRASLLCNRTTRDGEVDRRIAVLLYPTRSHMITTLLLSVVLHSPDVVERNSRVEFPAELRTPVGVQVLAGTGVRTRTVIVKVKVYTFGLYVDAERARVALEPWRGKTAVELANDATLYQKLLDGS